MPKKNTNEQKKKGNRRKTVSPDYTIQESYKRFNEKNNIFARIQWDKTLSTYQKSMYSRSPEIIKEKKSGYSHFEHAWALASWTVHDYFIDAFSWKKLGETRNTMEISPLGKFEISKENIEEVTKKLKIVAKSFGASLVGITELDERWIFSHDRKGKPIKLPEWIENVIILGIEMDAEAFGTSPTFIHGSANGLGYSAMAIVASTLAEFIRYLGYKAIPAGNDIGLSIPMAIDAGFGQLGRNGLLITNKYGPRVRLCKVFTNMPLIFDEPIDFGVTDYCRKCRKCAEACEVDAISFAKEPSFDILSKSNNKGIFRWAVDHEKCYEFWIENGGECSTCITVCPYNLKGGGKKDLSPKEFWEKKLPD
ncbi:MAG: reductive dehalogenase [Asgard group archaeon]|nr:reductive dehalogenase [Asgard group archaeon]